MIAKIGYCDIASPELVDRESVPVKDQIRMGWGRAFGRLDDAVPMKSFTRFALGAESQGEKAGSRRRVDGTAVASA
jgi:hypothetical protein